MKNTAFFFVALIAGSLASPTLPAAYNTASDLARNERIVTGQIIEAIENIAKQIREAGLDPFELTLEAAYELPVAILFSANAIIDNFSFTGLSNIVVQSMNYSILQSRLTFNIVLPGWAISVDKAETNAIFFGERYDVAASGSVVVNTIRLTGDIRVNVGVISGISIRSLSLTFSLGGIQSNLNVNIFGRDLSNWLNTLLGTTIPGNLNAFQREINQLLDIVALRVINDALQNRSFFL